MTSLKPINHQDHIPNVLQALVKVHEAIGGHQPDTKLQHLVYLRASQINGCGFCVKMHLEEARRDGETTERLDRLIVWRHVNDFSEAEKAAFAWTEALTELDKSSDLPALREELRKHFSEEQISVLTANIAMINMWNRVQISAY